jgi:hypothetical protein
MEGNMSEQTIQTADLYESALYHSLGYPVEKVEIIRENKKLMARFSFSGEGLSQIQFDYFNNKATVNLTDFRRSYLHISILIGSAKKENLSKLRGEGGQL